MPPSVLIVASTRAYADSQEILRIQDTAAALLERGNAVDVLVPRTSPLMTSVLNPSVRVFTVPRLVPFMRNPPRGPSQREVEAPDYMANIHFGDQKITGRETEMSNPSGFLTLVSKKKNSCIVVIKDGRYNLDRQLSEAIII